MDGNERIIAARAADTGDDSVLMPRRKDMYALRDERNRELGKRDDVRLNELAEGEVPALLVGLSPPKVRALAAEHVPGLLEE